MWGLRCPLGAPLGPWCPPGPKGGLGGPWAALNVAGWPGSRRCLALPCPSTQVGWFGGGSHPSRSPRGQNEAGWVPVGPCGCARAVWAAIGPLSFFSLAASLPFAALRCLLVGWFGGGSHAPRTPRGQNKAGWVLVGTRGGYGPRSSHFYFFANFREIADVRPSARLSLTMLRRRALHICNTR